MPSPLLALLDPRPLALACGLRAMPPTVRHVAILEAAASPYIVGGKVGVEEFVTAALLLSAEGDDAAAVLTEARATPITAFYATHPDALKADTAALSAHVEDAFKGYRVKRKPKQGGGNAASFAHCVHVLLRTEFGMGIAEAWGYPMRSAIMDIQCLNELHGARAIVGGSTAALLDAMAADRKKGAKDAS